MLKCVRTELPIYLTIETCICEIRIFGDANTDPAKILKETPPVAILLLELCNDVCGIIPSHQLLLTQVDHWRVMNEKRYQ